ncbi:MULTISPECIES: hypothetical protein [Haloferax]|uniref:Uncharacterized protein n=2 Tax=Haloferax TaxID=2251 RepID=A0A6G1YZH1_9EURY|nr:MULTISPECIES: hypothetical protein [Haloferax]KAB1187093.1 hypothetical protein Hfx1149_03210 [Haloferax sp. CBA1149]MRW79729.1 hypothetical protein [Haloferax marinisediminis]
MVESGDEDVPNVERIASEADRRREAWGATLDDMTALADEYEEEGWKTVRIAAGDTGTFGPGDAKGDDEAFGIAYVVPGDKAAEVSELFEASSFPEYEVYRAENDGRVYMVTALLAPDIETVVFVAGAWDLRTALNCATTAVERGRMYTFLQKLDGTLVGVVEHDDPEKFFPNLDAIRRYAPNAGSEETGAEDADDVEADAADDVTDESDA